MARLWSVGFESGESDQEISYSWTGIGSSWEISSSEGVRTGNYSAKFSIGTGSIGTPGAYVALVLDSGVTEIYARTCMTLLGRPVGAADEPYDPIYLSFNDADGDTHCSLGWEEGTLRPTLWRGDGSGPMGYNSTKIDTASGFSFKQYRTHLIEVHVVLHDTSGEVQVRVDGIEVIDFSGNTKGASGSTIDVIRVGQSRDFASAESYTLAHDDIGINDTTGSDQASWCGAGGILFLPANGAGPVTEWTVSDGGSNNYEMVDDVPADGTATYNYTAGTASGNKDLFAITDLPSTVDEIVLAYMQFQPFLAAAGSVDMLTKYRCGSAGAGTTEYTGGTSIVVWTDADWQLHGPIYDNPFTGIDWTPAEIDAIIAGYEVG